MLKVVVGRAWGRIRSRARREVIKEEVRGKEVGKRGIVRVIGRWREEAGKGKRKREGAEKEWRKRRMKRIMRAIRERIV